MKSCLLTILIVKKVKYQANIMKLLVVVASSSANASAHVGSVKPRSEHPLSLRGSDPHLPLLLKAVLLKGESLPDVVICCVSCFDLLVKPVPF